MSCDTLQTEPNLTLKWPSKVSQLRCDTLLVTGFLSLYCNKACKTAPMEIGVEKNAIWIVVIVSQLDQRMRGLWHVLTHASRNYDVYYLELVAYSRCYKAEIKHTKVSWKVSMKEMSNQEKSNNVILCAPPRNSTVLLVHFNAFGDLKVWWGILLVFPV